VGHANLVEDVLLGRGQLIEQQVALGSLERVARWVRHAVDQRARRRERDDGRPALLAKLRAGRLAQALQLLVVLHPREEHAALRVQLEAVEGHEPAGPLAFGAGEVAMTVR
jgi:hypothetical protein